MAFNSTTSIHLLDLLCEGPIDGIVGGLEGVFLNETPVKTGDTYNFDKNQVSFVQKPGAAKAAKSDTFGSVSTITQVGVEIGKNYSETLNDDNEVASPSDRDYGGGQLVRQITNTEVDSVQLLFTVPKLFSVAQEGLAKGQLFGGRIDLAIFVQDVGAGTIYKPALGKTFKGISTNNYQYLTSFIKLKGTGPWNIKAVKKDIGEDHFEIKYTDFEDISEKTPLANGRGNQIIWSSITEYTDQTVNHNFSAVAELQLSSETFPQLPTRSYLIKGRKVKIPTGAAVNPDTGALVLNDADFDNGPQTGEHWTSCPVCTFVDLLTNPRYGAGKFIDEDLISWADLYPLIKYANQSVDVKDGNGLVIATEPRFSCNVVIGDQADAFSVLQDMASVFRGMLFWSSNVIHVAADHGEYNGDPISPKHIYNNSNVVNGVFEYSGSSLKTRSTSIRVRYNDPDNFYKPNIVVVENPDLIAKYGYQVKELIGFGCTSKYQAQRVGLWALKSEELDEEAIGFSTGLDGAVVLPGEIFAVADELRQGTRITGRVSSSTTSSIVADQTITLPSGTNPTLSCVLADGSVETRAISSVSGSTINCASFTSAPLAGAVYSIATDSVALQKFRCISVNDGGDGSFAIVGVSHNDSIYAAVDGGEALDFLDITTLDDAPPPVENINLNTSQVFDGTGQDMQATISWVPGA